MLQLTNTDFKGFGISYRPEFQDYESHLQSFVQCVEVLLDDAFEDYAVEAAALSWDVPIAAHGLSFSPVRADFHISDRLDKLLQRAQQSGVSVVSEHLSLSKVGEYTIPNFMPSSKTKAEAERVGANVKQLAAAARRSIAMENPVTFFTHADDEMSEAKFMNMVSDVADCGLLLDVNNLFINAQNQHFDAEAFIDELDGDRIAYLHVAGHDEMDGLLLDSHASSVTKAVWDLTSYALRHTAASAVILERDNWSAGREELFSELSLLRDVWNSAR